MTDEQARQAIGELQSEVQNLRTFVSKLEDELVRFATILERVATAATETAQRQVETNAKLLQAGAFEKKSPIIMPGRH